MYTLVITPPLFSSNIYVHRQNLSNWLTRYVDIRLNVGTFVMSPDNLNQLDKMLIKYHYLFTDVVNTITLLEKDSFAFGN